MARWPPRAALTAMACCSSLATSSSLFTSALRSASISRSRRRCRSFASARSSSICCRPGHAEAAQKKSESISGYTANGMIKVESGRECKCKCKCQDKLLRACEVMALPGLALWAVSEAVPRSCAKGLRQGPKGSIRI